MEVIKKICKAGSVICLTEAVYFRSAGFAVASVVMAVIAVGIEIIEWRKEK